MASVAHEGKEAMSLALRRQSVFVAGCLFVTLAAAADSGLDEGSTTPSMQLALKPIPGLTTVPGEPASVVKPKPAQARLTVKATPTGAQIQIMNIKPKYRPGIGLYVSRYDIRVRKPGYDSYRRWHQLKAGEQVISVELKKSVTSDSRSVSSSSLTPVLESGVQTIGSDTRKLSPESKTNPPTENRKTNPNTRTKTTSSKEANFTPWMSPEKFQREFERQLKLNFYPKQVEGRKYRGGIQTRGVFVKFPPGQFAFWSRSGLLKAKYQRLHRTYVSKGFKKIWHQIFTDESGQERHQVIWIKN